VVTKKAEAAGKPLIAKAPKKMVKKLINPAKIDADETFENSSLFGGLFGEEEQVKEEKKVVSAFAQPFKNFALAECKVLGYILLTKPTTMNVRDPITVGCVFFNGKTNKYYLRVKKLSWHVNFLQNLVTIDAVSGRPFNKITGKQILNISDIEQLNLEILNHQETIYDLYTIFMRSQVIKKDWPKKDYKFSVFEDYADAELELEDCTRVLDFTRTSYSVNVSSTIHMLVEKATGDV
jgi:hypothetical protein